MSSQAVFLLTTLAVSAAIIAAFTYVAHEVGREKGAVEQADYTRATISKTSKTYFTMHTEQVERDAVAQFLSMLAKADDPATEDDSEPPYDDSLDSSI